MNKITNRIIDFIEQIKDSDTYASRAELKALFSDFEGVIKQYKDYTPSEIATVLLKDVISEITNLVDEGYALPGILVGINVPRFNISIANGYTNSFGYPIDNTSLFDLASITKLYTGVIVYKLMDEGILSFEDKITDIVKAGNPDKFKQLGDITVGDIMQFKVQFETPSRIDEAISTPKAKELLYQTTVVGKGAYNYNDIGMMILKEAVEEVTGKTFSGLFAEYIVEPLALENTFLAVPEDKRKLITGTPNAKKGLPNDPKAVIIGGYSGHAGVFANNPDLLRFISNLCINRDYFKARHFVDLVLPNLSDIRGRFGTTFTSHSTGLEKSFVDLRYPKETFAVQGSTRTQAIGGIIRNGKRSLTPIHFATSILMNPDSLSEREILERQDQINKELKEKGKQPLTLIRRGKFRDIDGGRAGFTTVNGRPLIPATKLDELNSKCAGAVLKLTLLGLLINEYEPHYDKQLDITLKIPK